MRTFDTGKVSEVYFVEANYNNTPCDVDCAGLTHSSFLKPSCKSSADSKLEQVEHLSVKYPALSRGCQKMSYTHSLILCTEIFSKRRKIFSSKCRGPRVNASSTKKF
jgi:hypothetical protein